MKIKTLIQYVGLTQTSAIEFDTLKPIDIGGIELDGYGAVKYQLATLHKEQSIEKVLVAHNTPNSKIKEYRKDMIPKIIVLAQTVNIDYEGTTRTTDISSKLKELMPSATSEIISECFEVFNEIQESMDAINVYLKKYKPSNAITQGYIKHHFPSPKFPEQVKN